MIPPVHLAHALGRARGPQFDLDLERVARAERLFYPSWHQSPVDGRCTRQTAMSAPRRARREIIGGGLSAGA